VLDDGTVACWGSNSFGELGNGVIGDQNRPVLVQGLTGATAVSVGTNHTCALTSSGTYCWGSNGLAELGDGTANEQAVPRPVDIPCD